MKRITIWVDCQDKRVENVRHEIEQFLKSLNLAFTVVSTDELVSIDEQTQ